MASCGKCGAEVAEGGQFCPKCGAAVSGGTIAQTAPTASVSPAAQVGLSENVAALLSYLFGLLTGLIFFLIDKRPFVRFHAAQSMVVFGGLLVVEVAIMVIFGMGMPGAFALGYALYSVISLVAFVLWILLMIKAYQHEKFELPVAGEIAKNLAGK